MEWLAVFNGLAGLETSLEKPVKNVLLHKERTQKHSEMMDGHKNHLNCESHGLCLMFL